MIPFEHRGPEWPLIRWIRSAQLALFLAIGAVLLFPFTLLGIFLRALGYLANARQLSR
jgi:hypothetical protein